MGRAKRWPHTDLSFPYNTRRLDVKRPDDKHISGELRVVQKIPPSFRISSRYGQRSKLTSTVQPRTLYWLSDSAWESKDCCWLFWRSRLCSKRYALSLSFGGHGWYILICWQRQQIVWKRLYRTERWADLKQLSKRIDDGFCFLRAERLTEWTAYCRKQVCRGKFSIAFHSVD